MSHDEFTKLYKYMSRKFDTIDKRLDQTATKAELNLVLNAVDALVKQTEIYHREMLVLNHRVDRHEGWIHKVAKATDIKLSA
jgi:hypothetical protein